MKNLINHDVTQTILTIVKPTSRGTIRGYSKGQSVTCTTLPQQSIQAARVLSTSGSRLQWQGPSARVVTKELRDGLSGST